MTDTPKCPKCNDKQWLYESKEDDDEAMVAVPCICLRRELFRQFLIKGSRGSRDIANADHVESELYTAKRDGTQENLFLQSSWDTACRHLKWALSAKYRQSTGFTFRVVDDDLLLQVWLGKKGYKARSIQTREEVESFNDLADLLEDPTFLVIRLGVVQRNRAVGDVLNMALSIRQRVSKYTWIVEDLNPYGPGHPGWSERTFDYLRDFYSFVELEDEVEIKRKREIHNEAADMDLDDLIVSMGSSNHDEPPPKSFDSIPHSRPPKRQKQDSYSNPVDSDLLGDDSPLVSNGNNKKKRWKR